MQGAMFKSSATGTTSQISIIMESLLAGLRAAGEPTRLRLMALCAHGELSVTEQS